MVVVEVVPRVGEDEIGPDVLEFFEDFLHFPADVRQEAVAKAMHSHVRYCRPGKEVPRARVGLGSTQTRPCEYDPRHLDLGPGSRKGKNRAPATDLDVVRMTPDHENTLDRAVALPE
jgi:hypothetical protein